MTYTLHNERYGGEIRLVPHEGPLFNSQLAKLAKTIQFFIEMYYCNFCPKLYLFLDNSTGKIVEIFGENALILLIKMHNARGKLAIIKYR